MTRATKPSRRTPAGRKPRGSGHETRDAILRAAKDLFAKEGYAAVTTRKLAQRAGVSQTGLYVYFRTKEEIYNALCTETFAKLAQKIHEASDPKQKPLERLRSKLENFISFGLEHPDEYALTFMVGDSALTSAQIKDLTLPYEKQGPGIRAFLDFRQMIANFAGEGVIKTQDITVTAQLVLNALHGTVAMLIARPWYPWIGPELLKTRTVNHIVLGLQRGEL